MIRRSVFKIISPSNNTCLIAVRFFGILLSPRNLQQDRLNEPLNLRTWVSNSSIATYLWGPLVRSHSIFDTQRIHVWNIYLYIYHKFMINVGKYSIFHGSYGLSRFDQRWILDLDWLSVFSGGALSEAARVETSRLKSRHVFDMSWWWIFGASRCVRWSWKGKKHLEIRISGRV